MTTAKRLIALATLSVTAVTYAHTQSPEIAKETERFIKIGGATSQSVADVHLKTQKALDTYNTITQGNSKDMKGDYKKLVNAQKDMNNQAADARKKIDEMDKQAAVYFTARSTAVGQIQDAALRDQAKTRLDENQKSYAKVKLALRDGGDALTKFTKDLSDQITFLGQELNPSSVASLKPQAEKLNSRGATLFTQADAAVTTANSYFNALKAE